ncbi:hypothetical protein AXF42_Ash005593 [Apostasia shenzhenica]|uniref:Uncharacterized protein n=1 Tax=Apostasia shenzhenica TaxID=1088818 RepID=A0A2I0BBV5_9ASPA|nr:hypothetical protein AXF42_Ash005593 [Apostasia shenzhenica]
MRTATHASKQCSSLIPIEMCLTLHTARASPPGCIMADGCEWGLPGFRGLLSFLELATGVDVELPTSPLNPPQHDPVSQKSNKNKASTTAVPNAKVQKVQPATPISVVDFCPASSTSLSTLQGTGQNPPKRKRDDVLTTLNPNSWHDDGDISSHKTPRPAGSSRNYFFANLFSAGYGLNDESNTRLGLQNQLPMAAP